MKELKKEECRILCKRYMSRLTVFCICCCLVLLLTSCSPSSHAPSLPWGKAIVTYHGHAKKVNSIAWSPDGKRIASASDDGTVQVWDADTGKRVLTYRGHAGPVTTVVWSLDRQHTISTRDDGTVPAR